MDGMRQTPGEGHKHRCKYKNMSVLFLLNREIYSMKKFTIGG